MNAGVLLCNFGEPAEPDREVVVDYLARIFYANASLEDADTEEEARERSRELAERRAPGLIAEYEAIGGSPLSAQAHAQAEALETVLAQRGYDVRTAVGMQFTEPLIEDAVSDLLASGIDRLIGVPVYPLCGPSTTVASLERMAEAVEDEEREADVTVRELTGWHRHPSYARLRADRIASYAVESGVDLEDPETRLVFSAHGTPLRYLKEGSRYGIYVEEVAETVAAMLGISEYELGYQNHANRAIPWTEPDVEDVIADLDAERVVVEPMSFMHEQSETLSELDIELREDADEAGLEFYRVPVPHDEPRFPALLADLLEPFLAGFDPAAVGLRSCQCRDDPNAYCLNAPWR